MKVFISTTTFAEYEDQPLKMLKDHGMEFQVNPLRKKLSGEELISLAKDAQGLIAGTEVLTAEVLKELKSLKVISRCGAGLDNVDLKAAKGLNIMVFNTPDAPTDAVAELTLGLMLDCLRKISGADRQIRHGKWNKPMGNLLKGKNVGIIGYGRIGKAVGRLAEAFGANVSAYDVAKDPDGKKYLSFDQLIAGSDIISLHVPGSKTGHLIHAKAVSNMKNGAFLINASRGGLVDEEALYEALKSGKLAGAGIDTFEKEPYQGKLIELDNAVLTSHIGSYAKESRINMEQQAVENLIRGLEEATANGRSNK
ncbi:MAG: phosphoglycerate dehydrogenase [Candidatus Saganbacteria bacterium]|nr:phosphoglycerate dehydrogenase [Candidatus Saganbacteria bacterium]